MFDVLYYLEKMIRGRNRNYVRSHFPCEIAIFAVTQTLCNVENPKLKYITKYFFMSNNLIPIEIVRLYRIWTSIIYRCTNPKNSQYKNYGKRGINVCDRWKDFNKFCEDVYEGSKAGLHLDRIDNDKGYSKDNCRWTTPKTNHRNKRNNTYYDTHIGKICQSELIEKMGFTRKQFQRAKEKFGEKKLLDLFKENNLPKKRVNPDLNDLVGKKVNRFFIVSLCDDGKKSIRYICQCECGKQTRIERFRLTHALAKECNSCNKRGDKNPKRKSL